MVLQTKEGQSFDRKSLKKVQGRTADFPELASDCVSFANASGGVIAIGIEDDAVAPPAGQHIEPHLSEKIRKRIGELTVNVQVLPELRHHENGSDYILLHIARSPGVASTCDGRYFVRVGDTSRPIEVSEERIHHRRKACRNFHPQNASMRRVWPVAAGVSKSGIGTHAGERVMRRELLA